MIGIEFTMEDGTKDWYDPVDLESWKETERAYIFSVNSFEYALLKEDVKSIRHYELCPKCGYEVLKTGCSHCLANTGGRQMGLNGMKKTKCEYCGRNRMIRVDSKPKICLSCRGIERMQRSRP